MPTWVHRLTVRATGGRRSTPGLLWIGPATAIELLRRRRRRRLLLLLPMRRRRLPQAGRLWLLVLLLAKAVPLAIQWQRAETATAAAWATNAGPGLLRLLLVRRLCGVEPALLRGGCEERLLPAAAFLLLEALPLLLLLGLPARVRMVLLQRLLRPVW